MAEASYSRFTAAEGGARLASAACNTNILAVEYASFISTRLVYEDAYKIRGSLIDGQQRSVYVTRASKVKCVAFELNILTDLSIAQGIDYSDVGDWCAELNKNEVLVCTSTVLKQILEKKVLVIPNVNVLVLDSCHLLCNDDSMQYIMKLYAECDVSKRPRILGLTYPLFAPTKKDIKDKQESLAINSASSSENITESFDSSPKIVEINEEINDEQTVDDKNCDIKNEIELTIGEKVLGSKENVDQQEEIGVYKNLDDFEMYEKLEWKIDNLEKQLFCQMDLAEDIDGGKRLSASLTKPKELLIEYSAKPSSEAQTEPYAQLDTFMRECVNDAMDFLKEHRYDPTEIYGEDLYEEFMNIPDPIIEPIYIFKQFLYILDQLGPYAADKAAFSLLTKLEKLKVKVPYERHFLLLCVCTTVFVKIRCYADSVFSNYTSDWEKIKLFCTPKVLRFAVILEKFEPPDQKESDKSGSPVCSDTTSVVNTEYNVNNKNDKTISKIDKMMDEINKCDFKTLGNKIEDRVNTYEANLKDLDDIIGNTDDNTNSNKADVKNKLNDNLTKTSEEEMKPADILQKGILGFPRRTGLRLRTRGRIQRNNAARVQQMQQNPDALCGIVFMKEALMAKIMFLLIVDMSRSHPKLSYLCAQYCAVENPADPGTEPKECQRQGKKQEEVLKKFRMHECNLLLATSALEEGIDLPRCNLVLRWDVPASYRSYGLCRGRARASRAACVLMSCGVENNTETLLHNLATYREIDQIISRKCGCGVQNEPPQSEEDNADTYTCFVKAYTPEDSINNYENNDSSDKRIDAFTKDKGNDYETNFVDENGKDDNKIHGVFDNGSSSSNGNIRYADLEITAHENNSEISVIPNDFNEKHNNGCVENIVSLNDNRVCNKCNSRRNSKFSECPCVSIMDKTNDGTRNDKFRSNIESKIDSKRKTDDRDNIASVDLSTAIALINRYCGKLPSDTFTRLAPQWWMEEVQLPVRGSNETKIAYICTLRLPLNCPVKYNIVGHPMPTRVLARRMVAFQACRILHKSGELDNQLMPIGKENFKAAELETGGNFGSPGDTNDPNDLARPGTTKRRQYYFKRTAWAFTDCQPVVDTNDSDIEPTNDMNKQLKNTSQPIELNKGKKRNMLYAIVSSLWCALPERYNTRGRRLHAPQNATQAIGILMARDEPDNLQIPAFPVYTRSGEVRVSVEHVPDADVRMSPRRGRLVRRFMRFVFAEVLRVRRRGMKLQNEGSTHNNYYIVPTVKCTRENGTTKIDIDWPFLELIYQHTEQKKNSEIEKPILWHPENDEDDEEDSPKENRVEGKEKKDKSEKKEVVKMDNPLLKQGETFIFSADEYKEAVVTPWYRNQDQPQFFLVAEICWNLSPDSAFPSATHTSFRNYYSSKYGVVLTQSNQPLLDVDHTSARLNLLTPRYVNRKGVALPVSSERTRRAKRDRLDQKQILVPELCRVHPFAAPLWFATVALPCVLYRINALLIADEIRRAVAIDVGLGIPKIDENTSPGFQWPPLDFGWSLAEVLNADAEKSEKKKEDDFEHMEDEKEMMSEKEGDKDENSEDEAEEKPNETKEKTINDILQEKMDADVSFEIGTWSNEMASSIPQTMEYDEFMEPLPPNLTFCTSASGGTNWCDPIQKPKNLFNPTKTYSMAESDCSYLSSDFDTDDSDLTSDESDDDLSGFCSSRNSNAAMGVRIEYKTAHEAEAVDVERNMKVNPAPQPDEIDDIRDKERYDEFIRSGTPPQEFIDKFRQSVTEHKKEIIEKGQLISKDKPITEILPELKDSPYKSIKTDKEIEEIADKLSKIDFKIDEYTKRLFEEIFPYGSDENLKVFENREISLENIEKSKRLLLEQLKKTLSNEDIKKLNCFSMIDVDIDSPNYVNEKVINVGFDTKNIYVERINHWDKTCEYKPYYEEGKDQYRKEFDFDFQPKLEGHPGPSPSLILQALTMSNANDGINLERLETIGDSFLKFAITAYLYCAHPTVHEGKLSHMRSKQVSNLNLYRLGRNKRLGARMIASKFEPHDNWLPPCHKPPPTLHPRLTADNLEQNVHNSEAPLEGTGCFIPYNLITQHSIPDKSIADCVEALIGAYLLECGPRGALIFMSWLGIRVLPKHLLPLPADHPYILNSDRDDLAASKPPPMPSPKREHRVTPNSESECSSDEDEEAWQEQKEQFPETDWSWPGRPVGSLRPYRDENGQWVQPIFGELKAPPSPLLRYIADPEGELEQMLSGYDALEKTLQYRFKDRSLLLQALTHASHQKNRLTDCYQRLEFLGDAILDYLITRHLYEDPRRHSPGALTDLRSALVNNTIFATLAARHGFHKYFRHMSPGLNEVLTKYVKIQEENGHSISEEHYLIQEDEMEQAEDVEVPKALGDLFESVAGAIFLDSGMSLGAVWKSYVNLMGAELEAFSAAAPKSPVRELLEAEPDTAKFGKPERLADGRRVRVCVEVFGRGAFKGVGRNYRIAKGTAARCALRHLRKHRPH